MDVEHLPGGRVLLQLTTEDGTDEQTVISTVTVEPLKHRWLVSVASSALVVAGWFVPTSLTALCFALAAAVALVYVALQPRTLTVRKPFKVRATRWNRFPHNNIVFPPDLGTPVVQIVAEVLPEEREDDDDGD